ncbi:MAG: SDR family oxidoreductase [Acidobacteria bacterium]|nr:MAG: SDR family oxidoreductase [Acidobacteriota bacterium]
MGAVGARRPGAVALGPLALEDATRRDGGDVPRRRRPGGVRRDHPASRSRGGAGVSVVPDLRGRRALVTGGTRGIGFAISSALAREGAHVTMGYRADEEAAARAVAAIRAAGGSASASARNLASPEEVRALVDEACGEDGLDVLVHDAALGSFKPVLDVKPNQWDLTLSVNARALLLLVRAAAERMREGGRVVAISSLGATRVVPSYGAIGVSKAALEALVRSLAAELAPRGITVNAVSAGLVETDGVRLHPGFEALRAAALSRSPAGRLTTAEEVAGAVLLLASPLASGITGQVLVVDGGLSAAF